LINLSNHPSVNWPQEQKLKAIELYQEIIDIPFPSIDPGDEEYIDRLSDEYLKKILDIKKENSIDLITCHVMGEQTFCHNIVNKLSQYSILSVASTTERIVEEENGVKKSIFKFVRFRRY